MIHITQADTMVLKYAEKKKGESRIELGLETNHECDSYLSVPPPYGTEQTRTQTQKSLKSNPLHRRVTMVIISDYKSQ